MRAILPQAVGGAPSVARVNRPEQRVARATPRRDGRGKFVGAKFANRPSMRFAALASLLLGGCLGGMPSPDPAGHTDHPPQAALTTMAARGGDPVPDPGDGADGGTVTAPSSTPDLGGLIDCYGVAACDPNMMFCIKFYPGSQSSPGTPTTAPACYAPDGASCADQGENMDCGCIQNDDILGPSCQTCVDNGDGTYSCFAQS